MKRFGEYKEKPVWLVELKNELLRCEIITYGAAVRSLTVPDREGKPLDVVLGYDTLEEYIADTNCFGAVVGPVANRIRAGRCRLNGKELYLTKNDGENCLHSGTAGLQARVWDVADCRDDAVTLTCVHPDGFGGIPGAIGIAVTYALRERSLWVEYWAVSEKDTLLNLTNHCYFNLDGHDSGPIGGHRVTLFAHSFTPVDEGLIPTGAIRAAVGTAMDLTHATELGPRLETEDEQLRSAGGFDHNYLVDPTDQGMGFRPVALVKAARTGISLAVRSDRPCVQFYTGNFIAEGLRGKDGAVYHRRQGLCLETQGFPDAPNHPSFQPITLKAGHAWRSITEFRFSV